jgi:predicted HTH domain antitoxin
MASVNVEIPDDLLANFDSRESISRFLFEDLVIEQRQRGFISLGRAAELLDLYYRQFFALLGSKGLVPIYASPEEIDESWRRFSPAIDHQ